MVDKSLWLRIFHMSATLFGSIQTIEADKVGSLRPAYGISIEDLER